MKNPLLIAVLLVSACVAGTTGDDSSPPIAEAGAGGVVSTTVHQAMTTSTSTSLHVTPVPLDGQAASGERSEFVDSTAVYGLIDPLVGMHGHAAAWGDLDGDGDADLVVGTFGDRPEEVYRERGASGANPDRLLLNGDAGFDLRADLGSGRTSGAVVVDLDGDMDNDLVLSRNVKSVGVGGDQTTAFENVDGGLVARPDSGPFSDLGGRTIGVFDEDGDGLLDLFIAEDRYAGGSSRLFRNTGSFTFVDVTEDRGLPADVEGLGVAVVDLDGDHLSDLFVSGSNRLFAGTADGFVEVDSSVFAWETFGDEDLVAGVATGDLDRDGRLDLVVGHHFNSTVDFGAEVPVRVYLNRSELGELSFMDVTEAVGMVGLPTKAPHVEVVDLDNDGWPDILTSASAGDGAVPAVFKHEGLSDGLPHFSPPDGLGSPQYWVTAPTADFDGDLRLDVLAVEWDPALPSILFRNTRPVGNAVRVEFSNVMAVGSRVSIFDSSTEELIGYQEVVASVGYSAGIESVAHFGIGDRTTVDLAVRLPDGTLHALERVPANSVVTVQG